MSDQAESLAQQFEAVNGEMIAFVEGCSDARWQTIVPEDQRTVAVVAHHVASAYAPTMGWVMSLTRGQPVELTMEQIDAANERHMAKYAHPTQAEVAALLHRNGDAAAAAIRALDDEQLHRKAHVELAVHGPWDAKHIILNVLMGHPRSHLADLRAAIQA